MGDMRRNTPKGEMSGNGSGPAIAHLPPMMKAMFTADAPIEYKPPIVKRKMPSYGGMSDAVKEFETETPEPRPPFEDPLQRRARVREEMAATNAEKVAAQLELWDPHKHPPPTNGEVTSDAYKTLFVARISYDTTQHKLRREFEQFGPIKSLRLVQDRDGESRGYAFLEYDREVDMKEAYKRADGRKIDARRVLVDVERGRTVRKWKPRRYGGGLGNTRAARKKGDKPGAVLSGRSMPTTSSSSSSGHYGGGGGGQYGGGGGGGGHYGSGGGGGGDGRYGPSGGGSSSRGGGDRSRRRSRSRSR